MAYKHQNQVPDHSRRYTVSYLLQLAPSKENSFDLSKFTYDAARAGVVPCLGDCAVPLRRTSGNRARNSSIGTTDTVDEPARQLSHLVEEKHTLCNPPVELRAQRDEGFARFLEKHSSPTHNRVTAGGRIVPMEKRESPPKFALPAQQNDNQNGTYKDEHVKTRSEIAPPHSTSGSGKAEYCSRGFQVQPFNPCEYEPQPALALDMKTPAMNYVQAYNGGTFRHPVALPAVQPLLSPPLPITGLHSSIQTNEISPFNNGYFVTQGPAYAYQTPTTVWPFLFPYADVYAPSVPDLADTQAQAHRNIQQSLIQANALYEDLDKQLKAIDRHRAMTSHDPELASQRMAIVQQRANAQEAKSSLQSQLLNIRYVEPLMHNNGTLFNVEAQTYIPQTMQFHNPEPVLQSKEVGHLPGDYGFQLHEAGHKRKAIPIIPPPAMTPSKQIVPVHTGSSGQASKLLEESTETRSGLNRLQTGSLRSTISNSLKECSHTTPERIDQREESKITPEGRDTSLASLEAPRVVNDTTNDEFAEHFEWLGSNPGRAPPHIEAEYERQLDALRKPAGVETIVERADGNNMMVLGCNLQRPHSADMDEFERNYWDRKPVQVSEENACTGTESIEASLSVINDGSPPAENQNMFVFIGQGVTKTPNHNKSTWNQPSSMTPLRKTDSNSDMNCDLVLRNHVDNIPSQENTANHCILPTSPKEKMIPQLENDLFDPFDSKGYSSISVQNIHATVSPVKNSEEATKITRRSVQSLLAAAMKHRSPRLLHRSTPNGGAWYGPYRREFHSTSNVEEN